MIFCSNATNSQTDACIGGYYIDKSGPSDVCVPCQYNASNVPSGFYLSSVCDGTSTSDVSAITECTAVPNCAGGVICTNAGDSQCTSCDANFYLDGGNCLACTAIDNSAGMIFCSNATNSQTDACVGDYYIDESGPSDVCVPCQYNASNVPSGFYLSSVCDGTSTSDVSAITECTAVPGCNELVCTNASDQTCISFSTFVEVKSNLKIEEVPVDNSTLNVLTLLEDGTVAQKNAELRVSLTNDTLFVGTKWVIIPGISAANNQN
jgi:hypothetical protein